LHNVSNERNMLAPSQLVAEHKTIERFLWWSLSGQFSIQSGGKFHSVWYIVSILMYSYLPPCHNFRSAWSFWYLTIRLQHTPVRVQLTIARMYLKHTHTFHYLAIDSDKIC
jgi:hypothetical protein